MVSVPSAWGEICVTRRTKGMVEQDFGWGYGDLPTAMGPLPAVRGYRQLVEVNPLKLVNLSRGSNNLSRCFH